MVNFPVKFDPLMWWTFRQAQEIYVTSEQTEKLVPTRFHKKTKVQLTIGLDDEEIHKPVRKTNHTGLCVLYVGRFLYWKGMGSGIQAFARLAQQIPGARLTMVGKGPDEKRWRQLAERLNIAEQIDWILWVDMKELAEIYQSHDIFLFPSLHDSGGMVVLEAMAHGLPIVCLDLGGPGIIVNHSCGRVINTKGVNEAEVCKALCNALLELAIDKELLSRLKCGALKRCNRYEWDEIVGHIYSGKKHG